MFFIIILKCRILKNFRSFCKNNNYKKLLIKIYKYKSMKKFNYKYFL